MGWAQTPVVEFVLLRYVLIPAENGTVESDAYFERTCDVAQERRKEVAALVWSLNTGGTGQK